MVTEHQEKSIEWLCLPESLTKLVHLPFYNM